jgi:phosphodiesterase/alkaline phosphatase D-like protein
VIPGGITQGSVRLRLNRPPQDHPITLAPKGGAPHPLRLDVWEAFEGCWGVDVQDLRPDTEYEVRVAGRVGDPPLRIRTPPVSLAGGRELLVGLQSCYFPSRGEYDHGRAVLECWRERRGHASSDLPHLTILSGDQIYADVPGGGFASVEEIHADRYREVWRHDRLGACLQHGAHFFACDDHEFWNDYPGRMLHLSRSWDGAWQRSARAALDSFWREQAQWNFAVGVRGGADHLRGWCTVDLCREVSLFVADTRSDRTTLPDHDHPGARKVRRPDRVEGRPDELARVREDRVGFFSQAQERALEAWLRGIGRHRVGLLALGQPLAHLGGGFDLSLANYAEPYARLLTAIDEAAAAGATVVILSGDIHWGRLLELRGPRFRPSSGGRVLEFVSSPVALVANSHFLGGWMPSIGRARDRHPTVKWDPPPSGWTAPTTRFDTLQPNMGVLRVGEGPDGGPPELCFELWNLEDKVRALNRADREPCRHPSEPKA